MYHYVVLIIFAAPLFFRANTLLQGMVPSIGAEGQEKGPNIIYFFARLLIETGAASPSRNSTIVSFFF